MTKMTKSEFKNLMKAWDAKNKKINNRARAVSIETQIENDISYTEDIATFTEATKKGYLKTGFYNPYNDFSIMR